MGSGLSPEVAEQIVHGPYNPSQPIEPAALLDQARAWLRALPPLKGAH